MTYTALARELHIVDDEGFRETYEEFYTESDVERLFYERLQFNRHIVKATLVYRNAKTGVIVDRIKLK